MRLIVGITGASGAIFGIRTLEALRELGIETHLIISQWARSTIAHETSFSLAQVEALATTVYHHDNQAAPISSGSFKTDGMIVAPCSMKTLAAIRAGFGDSLITRAADVALKERRKLILVPRETPWNLIHARNIVTVTEAGAIVMPASPSFYSHPKDFDELADTVVWRVMDQLGLEAPNACRWRDGGVADEA